MRVVVRPEAVQTTPVVTETLGRLCRGVADYPSAVAYHSGLKDAGYRVTWSEEARRLVVHRPPRHRPRRGAMLNVMHCLGIDSAEGWEALRASLGL